MNAISRNEAGEYYIASVYVTPNSHYAVRGVYLLTDGTKRADGGKWHFQTKKEAVERMAKLMHTKKRMKGFQTIDVSELPSIAKRFLKPDVEYYLPPEEMLKMVREAIDERYVEFNCVTGLEERFDEGLEYLALVDKEDKGFFWVWDRNGVQCRCHESRFSRVEHTERSREVNAVLGVQ